MILYLLSSDLECNDHMKSPNYKITGRLDCYNKNCDVLYNKKLLDSLDRNLWMNKCNWPVTVPVPLKKIFTMKIRLKLLKIFTRKILKLIITNFKKIKKVTFIPIKLFIL